MFSAEKIKWKKDLLWSQLTYWTQKIQTRTANAQGTVFKIKFKIQTRE